jgi:hypothetical protein
MDRIRSDSSADAGHPYVDVIQRILDKGIVIDSWGRISVASIDLFTVESRVVVASIETYLKRADAVRKIPWVLGPSPGRPAPETMPEPSDAGWGWHSSDAAVRAAEHYLEQLREGGGLEGW